MPHYGIPLRTALREEPEYVRVEKEHSEHRTMFFAGIIVSAFIAMIGVVIHWLDFAWYWNIIPYLAVAYGLQWSGRKTYKHYRLMLY